MIWELPIQERNGQWILLPLLSVQKMLEMKEAQGESVFVALYTNE